MAIITEEMRFRKRLCDFALDTELLKRQGAITLIGCLYIDNWKNMMEELEA